MILKDYVKELIYSDKVKHINHKEDYINIYADKSVHYSEFYGDHLYPFSALYFKDIKIIEPMFEYLKNHIKEDLQGILIPTPEAILSIKIDEQELNTISEHKELIKNRLRDCYNGKYKLKKCVNCNKDVGDNKFNYLSLKVNEAGIFPACKDCREVVGRIMDFLEKTKEFN